MELNELKSAWKNTGEALKSEVEIQKMTKINNHPSLKKIRRKLLIESMGLTLFLIVYHDWFDGHTKPMYVNALLVSSVVLYVLNDVVGYISLVKPVSGLNLKVSAQKFLARIKRLAVLSLIISMLYGSTLVLFFTSVISFTKTKYLVLGAIVLVFLVMTYYSWKIWNRWIKNLKLQVQDFQ